MIFFNKKKKYVKKVAFRAIMSLKSFLCNLSPTDFILRSDLGMPIPLQEMILGESGDRGMANCYSPGKGEFSAYSSGFGVGELGNKNTKYRHNLESLVHNQHYTLEILGFHHMLLSKFEVKSRKFLIYKNNFYNSGIWILLLKALLYYFSTKRKKLSRKLLFGDLGE